MVGEDKGARRYVALAEVTRPHGIRGELRLKLFNPDSDVLERRPPVRLVLPSGEQRSADIRATRRVPGALLVRLRGVEDRDAAEALRGARLEVAREVLGPTEEDEYYFCDLEGCEVRLEGSLLGVVTAVVSYPTVAALVVDRADGGRLEVPLHDDFVGRIDTEAKRIDLVTIEGLS